jgi:hypothetical protein
MRRACLCEHTLWEQTAVAIDQVLAQKPAVAEFVVSFGQLDTIAFLETQFIGAAGLEIVCTVCPR